MGSGIPTLAGYPESMSEMPAVERIPSRRLPLIAGGTAVLLGVLLGVVIAFRPKEPFVIDTKWMAEMIEWRNPVLDAISYAMNWLGGGLVGSIIIPLAFVVTFFLLRRPWAALYFASASLVSVTIVQILKVTVDRTRPPDMLVTSDLGSFPSGHTANAATMAVVLGLILLNRWVWLAGILYTLLMAFTRTYLGAHWISDTIGGILVGAGVAVIVWTLFEPKLRAERHRHTHVA